MESDAIISLSGVGFARDGRTILSDINLDVRRGDFIAITGPNGGGKTTLLRILLRLVKPSAGRVAYGSETMSIGYLPQKNMIDSHFPMTVREVVASGLAGTRASRADEARMVGEILDEVGLASHADKSLGVLSGGQLQRALLGRAIISHPELLVFDEPLSYVDKQFEQKIYSLVAELSKEATILLVSHEMSAIAAMANRHLIIDHTLTECHARHHGVRFECDEDEVNPPTP